MIEHLGNAPSSQMMLILLHSKSDAKTAFEKVFEAK